MICCRPGAGVPCAKQANGPHCTELQGGVNHGVRTREPCSRCPKDGGRHTKSAQEPNGMKLASELLLNQLLTQFLPGFDHQREALRSAFLDAWLHAMRSSGVDDQRSYRYSGTRCAE